MTRSPLRSAAASSRAVLGVALLTLAISNVSSAQSISIAPDPGFGYLPLAAFDIDPITGVGDNTSHDFDLPAFLWGGQSYTSLSMSSNGYLIVGGGDASSAMNQVLPNSGAPNNVLAPFWTDLVPGAAGSMRIGLLSDGVGIWAVMDWDRMAIATAPTLLNSFQVWIGTNGVEDITFMYGDMSGSGGAPYTVGAENFSGDVGAMWSHNGTGESPATNSELRVTSSGAPNLNAVPEPASVALVGVGILLLAAARARSGIGTEVVQKVE